MHERIVSTELAGRPAVARCSCCLGTDKPRTTALWDIKGVPASDTPVHSSMQDGCRGIAGKAEPAKGRRAERRIWGLRLTQQCQCEGKRVIWNDEY